MEQFPEHKKPEEAQQPYIEQHAPESDGDDEKTPVISVEESTVAKRGLAGAIKDFRERLGVAHKTREKITVYDSTGKTAEQLTQQTKVRGMRGLSGDRDGVATRTTLYSHHGPFGLMKHKMNRRGSRLDPVDIIDRSRLAAVQEELSLARGDIRLGYDRLTELNDKQDSIVVKPNGSVAIDPAIGKTISSLTWRDTDESGKAREYRVLYPGSRLSGAKNSNGDNIWAGVWTVEVSGEGDKPAKQSMHSTEILEVLGKQLGHEPIKKADEEQGIGQESTGKQSSEPISTKDFNPMLNVTPEAAIIDDQSEKLPGQNYQVGYINALEIMRSQDNPNLDYALEDLSGLEPSIKDEIRGDIIGQSLADVHGKGAAPEAALREEQVKELRDAIIQGTDIVGVHYTLKGGTSIEITAQQEKDGEMRYSVLAVNNKSDGDDEKIIYKLTAEQFLEQLDKEK